MPTIPEFKRGFALRPRADDFPADDSLAVERIPAPANGGGERPARAPTVAPSPRQNQCGKGFRNDARPSAADGLIDRDAPGRTIAGTAGSFRSGGRATGRPGAGHRASHAGPAPAARPSAAGHDGVRLFLHAAGGPAADAVFDQLARHAKVPVIARLAPGDSERPDLDPVALTHRRAREADMACFSRSSRTMRRNFAQGRMTALRRAGRIQSTGRIVKGFENAWPAPRATLAGAHSGKTPVRRPPAAGGD